MKNMLSSIMREKIIHRQIFSTDQHHQSPNPQQQWHFFQWQCFLHAICDIIGSVIGERAFSSAYHLIALREERSDGQKIRNYTNKAKLKGLVKSLKALDRRFIIHTKNTGSYLIIRVTTVTGTVLAATKIRDFFCACYYFIPISLQKQCDR